MKDELEKTITDLRRQLIEARQRADRYNEDRQKLIKQVQRLRALLKVIVSLHEKNMKNKISKKDATTEEDKATKKETENGA